MIVPDTNILIAYFSQLEPAFSLMENYLQRNKILLSIVAVAEFLVKATQKETIIMNQIINEIGVVLLDRNIMEQAVSYRKRTLRKTKRIHLLDCFIAACAKVHRATLVTLDRKDYPFTGLKVKQPEEF